MTGVDADDPAEDASPAHNMQPVSAPPAPTRMHAPHNLYDTNEVADALKAMHAYGLAKYESDSVLVTWRNGGTSSVSVDDVRRITDPDDVDSIYILWRFRDNSSLRGSFVNRPRAGSLEASGGVARAAANDGLEALRALRPHRARWRAFVSGYGLSASIYGSLMLIGLVALAAADPKDRFKSGYTPVSIITGVVLGGALGQLVTRWRMAAGGTRLTLTSTAQRKVFGTEVAGVVALATFIVLVVRLLFEAAAG